MREEAGLVADRWQLLGMLDVAPGMSAQSGRVLLATAAYALLLLHERS